MIAGGLTLAPCQQPVCFMQPWPHVSLRDALFLHGPSLFPRGTHIYAPCDASFDCEGVASEAGRGTEISFVARYKDTRPSLDFLRLVD